MLNEEGLTIDDLGDSLRTESPTKIRILHVDDDSEHLEIVKINLDFISDDLAITSVESGRQALDILESDSFDCIISDLHMPGMDGLELLQSLKSKMIETPVIILTSTDNPELVSQAQNSGVRDYILKNRRQNMYLHLIESINEAVKPIHSTSR